MQRSSRLATLFVAFLAPLAARCSAIDAEEAARLVEVMALAPGMDVADVGAGDGEWSRLLADTVGPEGTVYATEVEDDLVEDLRQLGVDENRFNLVAVRGDPRSTGLDPGCCDRILLRMVYHHFTDPPAMRESLLAALRPGGRIAVIDIVPQQGWRELPGTPDRGGHGIPMEDLVAEMLGAGFALETVQEAWPGSDEDRYCVVFQKPL